MLTAAVRCRTPLACVGTGDRARCLVAGDLERRRRGGAWAFPKGVLTVGLLRAVLCRAAERARGAMRQPPRLRRLSRYLAEFWALLPVSRAGK